VVAGHLDDGRLDGLYRIGIDEVSYRKGHRYLTVVADHDRAGAVVWAGEGMSSATLERFFDTLGPDRTAQLQAASMDLHGAYAKVTSAITRTDLTDLRLSLQASTWRVPVGGCRLGVRSGGPCWYRLGAGVGQRDRRVRPE
jgi:hypothetical protein